MIPDATSGRLAHHPTQFTLVPPATDPSPTLPQPARVPSLALSAEGPRRADLVAWASAHRATLATMRLLAPAGIGALLAEHVGLAPEALKSGTIGPTATAGLAAAGDIHAMVAFMDPIELRPGDTTTRSLTRLALFWDIPVAGNRATADLLLATLATARPASATDAAVTDLRDTAKGAVKLWTVRATVEDVPGRLAILAASLARRAVNILSVQVHPTPEGPVDELLVAASPVLSGRELAAAVVDGGGRTPRVAPADAHALVDAPTRALNLASRLVRAPDALPEVLTSLVPGAELTWHADIAAGGEAPDEGGQRALADAASTTLWLADPAGGVFLLSRPAVPFTPAECARVFAMLDLALDLAVARTEHRG